MLELTGRAGDGWVPTSGYADPEELGGMTRLLDAAAEAAEPVGAAGRVGQQTLLAVHQHLRQELEQLRGVVQQVGEGRTTAASARSHLHQMTMRQNYWTFGAFCRVVSVHHAIEDAHLFRDLRRAETTLGPVLERLSAEHEAIAAIITGVDDALVAMIQDEGRVDQAERAVDRLADALLPHLDHEERQLLDPIGRLDIRV